VLRPTDLYYQFGSWNRVSLEDDLFRALPAGEATSQHVSRVLANLLVAVSVLVQPAVSLDLETAREIGEAKRAEQESRLPPRVRLPSGVVYRELRPGDGLVLHWDEQPDVVLSWAVLRPTDLYYQFGSWNRVSLEDDLFRALPAGEATLVCGLAHGLEGAREHALRRIWVPASLGYVRGDEVPQPRPDDFGAQRRFTRLRQRNADLVFEVEVRRVRPNGGSKLHVCPLGSEQ
jgi:FKBP-type peptidyl-prolyl cis-trans isomerase